MGKEYACNAGDPGSVPGSGRSAGEGIDYPHQCSCQCKEIEENNRMGKTRDLFKKIRDTKGTFHAKMGKIRTEMVLYCAHFAWNVYLKSLIFLMRSLVFPILLFSSISLHCSLK